MPLRRGSNAEYYVGSRKRIPHHLWTETEIIVRESDYRLNTPSAPLWPIDVNFQPDLSSRFGK
jgi:hypothetical protein